MNDKGDVMIQFCAACQTAGQHLLIWPLSLAPQTDWPTERCPLTRTLEALLAHWDFFLSFLSQHCILPKVSLLVQGTAVCVRGGHNDGIWCEKGSIIFGWETF